MTAHLKILFGLFILVCALGAGVLTMQRSETVKQYLAERKLSQVLGDYTDKTVTGTLSRLLDELDQLDATVRSLHAEPTDDKVLAATELWRKARGSYKQTTAFMYGPAAQYNFDKQLATWPLDQVLVDHVLGEMAAGQRPLDATQLRTRMQSSQRGLLVAEYLLFRNGEPRPAAQIKPEELDYLKAVSEVMVLEASDYLAAWIGTAKLPAKYVDMIEAAGIKPRMAFGDEFKHPGSADSRYASPSVPLQEIFQDSFAAIEELCPVIEEALGSSDPRDSDTWFSNNALADAINTVKSVDNSYLGGTGDDRGHAVADLLATQNSILDRRIKIGLADLAYRIGDTGDPYAEHGADRELAVRRAVASCHKLIERLGAAMPLVSLDPTTRPWAAYGM